MIQEVTIRRIFTSDESESFYNEVCENIRNPRFTLISHKDEEETRIFFFEFKEDSEILKTFVELNLALHPFTP